ncbi:hypothetical protein IU459_17435 [Nocardia amamiensis]|uniref:Uncharacterized protein n=1 Tax=Nocardia amamiensis TaxID=404578 RepID=A0ABS0CU20_9NOCA|nr:hypothetical protein [Nocardia amamiensis]MBF6299312.1 hypothetical protein [Nocardia amamiensis]
MSDPTLADLVRSIIEAGRDWDLGIVERNGSLWIERRAGELVRPPVEIQFAAEELAEYYQRTVSEGGYEASPQSPWEWWKSLLSTHLAEAMYKQGRLAGRGVIRIGEFGLTAVALD